MNFSRLRSWASACGQRATVYLRDVSHLRKPPHCAIRAFVFHYQGVCMMSLDNAAVPASRRRRRGMHLDMALAGNYGPEIAEAVAKLLEHGVKETEKVPAVTTTAVEAVMIKPSAPVRRKLVVGSETRPPSAAETVSTGKTDTSPPAGSRQPLPEGHTEESLRAEASASRGERATRLRTVAALYAGMDPAAAAAECGVGLGKVYLWLARFREGGTAAM